jgi:hypothetical protein
MFIFLWCRGSSLRRILHEYGRGLEIEIVPVLSRGGEVTNGGGRLRD